MEKMLVCILLWTQILFGSSESIHHNNEIDSHERVENNHDDPTFRIKNIVISIQNEKPHPRYFSFLFIRGADLSYFFHQGEFRDAFDVFDQISKFCFLFMLAPWAVTYDILLLPIFFPIDFVKYYKHKKSTKRIKNLLFILNENRINESFLGKINRKRNENKKEDLSENKALSMISFHLRTWPFALKDMTDQFIENALINA